MHHLFIFIDCPRINEPLAAALLDLFLVDLVKIVDPDHQLASQVVEQHPGHALALGRRRRCQGGVLPLPLTLTGAQLIQRDVVDPEQPALLQVWGRDAPPAPQVLIDAIGQDLAQRAVGLCPLLEPDRGIDRVQLHRQVERLKDALGQNRVLKPTWSRTAHSAIDPRAQQADFDKVVEMPGLQGSILPVVGEAQQLSRLTVQRIVAAQGTERG